jgi:hypothetical protein
MDGQLPFRDRAYPIVATSSGDRREHFPGDGLANCILAETSWPQRKDFLFAQIPNYAAQHEWAASHNWWRSSSNARRPFLAEVQIG